MIAAKFRTYTTADTVCVKIRSDMIFGNRITDLQTPNTKLIME